MKAIILLALVFVSNGSAQQSMIRGKILGADGHALLLAHVTVSKHEETGTRMSVNPDGSFQLSLIRSGRYNLTASGVNHSTTQFQFYIGRPDTISVKISLRPYRYIANPGNVFIVGNFNNFSTSDHAVPMKQQPDGTWLAEVLTDTILKYQLSGLVEGRTVNGTLSERFEIDESGDYVSIITPKDGKAVVRFDPAQLPQIMKDPSAEFADSLNRCIEDYRVFSVKWRRSLSTASRRSQQGSERWEDSVRTIARARYQAMLNKADYESSQLFRDFYRMQALHFQYLNSTPDSAAINQGRLVAVESPALSAYLDVYALLCEKEMDLFGNSAMFDAFLLSSQAPDEKEQFLYRILVSAHAYRRDSSQIRAVYRRLLEDYPAGNTALAAKLCCNIDSKIAPGKPCPAFRVKRSSDTLKMFTERSFIGKTVILHFWGASAEQFIPELSDLYRQYGKDSLEIISFELNGKTGDQVQTSKIASLMPWNHVWSGTPVNQQFLETLDVPCAPFLILVDRKGYIQLSGHALIVGGELALELRALIDK